MGTLLCRKAVFWRLLTMLFFLLFVAGDDDLLLCDKLEVDMLVNKTDFFTCIRQEMMIKANKNKSFPIADFSDFTQDEIKNLTAVKDKFGKIDEKLDRLFAGNFLLESSAVSHIQLGFYVGIKNTKYSFVLKNNWNLTDVKITTLTNDSIQYINDIQFQLIIRNNKLLTNESLEALRSIEYYDAANSYIQQYGECTLNQNGLSTTEDLEDCHYTTNDLVITDKTVLTDTKALDLTKVDGCIRISGTNYTDLNVISTIQTTNCSSSHEITNNGELCLHPEEIANLTNRIGKLVYKNNSKCLRRCSVDYFLTQKDPECEIIDGDIEIENVSDDTDMSHFSNVKIIKGHLIVCNTQLENLDFFNQVVEIGSGCQNGPALLIHENKNLERIEFVKTLKSVNCDRSKIWIQVEHNSPNLRFSLPQIAKLYKFGLVRLPVENPEENQYIGHVRRCTNSCNSEFATNKDLCCVLNGYKKFYGCLNKKGEIRAYCSVN